MRFVDCDLKNQLPTKRDIINFGLYLRHRSDRRRKLGVYKQEILRKVRLLWQRAGIPILSNSVTRRKLDSVVNKYYNVVKHPSKYDENEWNTLFVISRCVCRIEKNNLCNCTACNKIPDDTKTFFIDQCGPRLMTLDNVDVRSTNDIQQMTKVCSSNTIRSDVYSIEYLPDSEEEQEFEENVSGTKKKYISIEDISLRNFCSALDLVIPKIPSDLFIQFMNLQWRSPMNNAWATFYLSSRAGRNTASLNPDKILWTKISVTRQTIH